MCSNSVPSFAGLSTCSFPRDCNRLGITPGNAALQGSNTLPTQSPEPRPNTTLFPDNQSALEKLLLKKMVMNYIRVLGFLLLAVGIAVVSKKLYKKSWSQYFEDADPCVEGRTEKEGRVLPYNKGGTLARRLRLDLHHKKNEYKLF